MPRGTQVARLYTLLLELGRAPRGVLAQNLATRLGVRLRTVYRDLEALRQAGFPVERVDGARWRLPEEWQAQLPFPLPAEELFALHAAREFLRPLRGTPIEQAFGKLCHRLLGATSQQGELFPYYRTLVQTRSTLAIDYRPHLDKIEVLCTALQQHRTIRAVYAGLARSEPTQRDLDPYRLYYDPALEALYLFAWCHLRKAVRVFAVHRFHSVQLTERTFSPPLHFDVETFLKDAFRLWREENVQHVRFRVYPPLARWVAERRLHASQLQRRLDGGAIEVELTVEASEDIKRFLLQLGASAEVLAPESLRNAVANELTRALRRYLVRPRETLSPDDKQPLPARSAHLKKGAVRAGTRRQRKAR